MEIKANQNTNGLNLDSLNWQIQNNQLTWALNANIHSHDGNTFTYTNEMSNQVCVDFNVLKPGYKIVGLLNIIEQDKVVVFLKGPNGKGEIGVITSNGKDCIELEQVETDCGCVKGKVLSTNVTQTLVPTLSCPPGYIYDAILDTCIKTEYVSASFTTTTYGIDKADSVADYGIISPALYSPGYSSAGVGAFSTLTQSWWTNANPPVDPTYVDVIGIKPTTGYVVNTWVTFRQTICVQETKQYYIAVAADDNIVVKLDSVPILTFDNTPGSAFQTQHSPATTPGRALFQRLHIYPITITAGNHTLEFEYINVMLQAMFACEIYDNTAAELTAATSDLDLVKIFSTADYIDPGAFTEVKFTCPAGYNLTTLEDCSVGCFKQTTSDKIYSKETCCTYEPILIDECCQDCCPECVNIQIIKKPTAPSGTVSVRWVDCNGQEQYNSFDSGFGPLNAIKDSFVIEPAYVDWVQQINYTPVDSNCEPCLNAGTSKYCCLNFDIENPIYSAYRVDQCETRIYFVDRKNPPRYLSLEFPLNRDACGEAQDCSGKKLVTAKTCADLKIFPDTCHPRIYPDKVNSGGNLKAGTYQFSIAYCDEDGAEMTDFFDFSQPIPIFEKKLTNLTDYETNYSINVKIQHQANAFDFFKLIVAETIQAGTVKFGVIGIYRVSKPSLEDNIVYTGAIDSVFSTEAALARTPYYNTAGIVEHQNDILMLADLEKEYQYNFQPFANKIKLLWETVEMPVGGRFDYSNPEIAYFFRTYQRDEVYAFGIKFKLKSGKYTEVFHIPGRAKLLGDNQVIPATNKDNFLEEGDCVPPPVTKERWQVYNTATKVGWTPYDGLDYEKQYNCEITGDNKGEFAYWESSELYPCNEEIWDTDAWGNPLAGKPIRHHKFPDSAITHIHDSRVNPGNVWKQFEDDSNIYPIGVRIDIDSFNNLLNTFLISNPNEAGEPFVAKDLICGFELVRGSRVGEKSVIAKGIVYDVGTFENNDKTKTYYYPNYPFNDLGWNGQSVISDPYLRTDSRWYDKGRDYPDNNYKHIGFVKDNIINYRHERFTFHSPDTHFAYPKPGIELKLETVEFGRALGHFVQVDEHSETRLLTNKIDTVSTLLSIAMSFKEYQMDFSNFIQDKQAFISIFEKLIPRVNYAWQYNGIAKYNNYRPIGNAGNKRRRIKFSNYAPSEILTFGQGEKPFHNRFRESSVYLSLADTFVQEAQDVIDNTRYIFSQGSAGKPTDVELRDTRVYYTSLKSPRVNQYGQLTNINYVSTGYHVNIITDPYFPLAGVEETYYPAFGGDTYINLFTLKRKHAFFRQNLAGKPNDLAGNYFLLPNLGYPSYFYGMQPEIKDPEQILRNLITDFIAAFAAATIAAAGLIIAGVSPAEAYKISIAIFKNAFIFIIIGNLSDIFGGLIPSLYLDNYRKNLSLENGISRFFYYDAMMYLFSYGLPIFFVESDVNVDFRHGRNEREENFYGHKELGEIPDQWLQEINVPIRYDNFYHYNHTYSIQNVLNPNFPYNEFYPELYCETDLYNRVVYSDPANKYIGDPWLNFRRNNFYDFPKTSGKLIALNAIENAKVYARFENSTKLYNAIITLESNNPTALELGNASMFNQKPIDLSTSDTGYLGTQHKAFIKTTHGGFWVDAKRGHVYQVSGSSGVEEISNKNTMHWFKEHLPFSILKDFPDFPVDNTVKGIGISLGWDERYHRLFVTKLDYRLKSQYRGKTVYQDGKFYYDDVTFEFADPLFFENKSWTISYSVLLKAWISFHSFLPNHYVSLIDHFQTVTQTATWNHNLSPFTYQTYYNKFYPYIIEYPVNISPNSATVNSVTYVQDIQKYYNREDYYSLGSYNGKNTPNFTKAIIYNKEQTTGVVKLIAQVPNDARQMLTYPRVSGGAFETLLTKREHKNTFNGFWDATNSKLNNQSLFSTEWTNIQSEYPIDKVVNTKAVIYNSVTTGKQRIRGTFARVRLIQDLYNRFKFINNLQLAQTNNSIS